MADASLGGVFSSRQAWPQMCQRLEQLGLWIGGRLRKSSTLDVKTHINPLQMCQHLEQLTRTIEMTVGPMLQTATARKVGCSC